jgi:phage head maturation protease
MSALKRRDVSQMSFGFSTLGDEWRMDITPPERTLTDVELFDVSPVTFPAYPQTEVALRSLEQAREIVTPPQAPPPAPPVDRLERQIQALDREE